MRRFALVLLLVAVPSIGLANPDGPVGSLVLVPRYAFSGDGASANSGIFGEFQAERAWEAGAGFLVPATNHLTIAASVMYGNRPGTTGVAAPLDPRFPSSDTVAISAGSGFVVEFEAKIYIPLSGGAKEKLKNWDERR